MSLRWKIEKYCFTRDELISFFMKYFRCEKGSLREKELTEFVDSYIKSLNNDSAETVK